MHKQNTIWTPVIFTLLFLAGNIVVAQNTQNTKPVPAKVSGEKEVSKKPAITNRPLGEKLSKDAIKAAPYLMKNNPDTTTLPHDPIEPGHTVIEKVIDASKK